MTTLWQSRFTVPADALELFLEGLDGEGMSVTAFETRAPGGGHELCWRIDLIHEHEPDQRALAARLASLAERAGIARLDLSLAPVADEDWVARVAEQFPAQQIGRFWIHGSHVGGPPPPDTVPILIDAGPAFGSGEHATTRGCLRALDRLAARRRFRRVLDLGCGSGVLAIAAAKCWPARVVAADNDPAAVAVARENVVHNRVAHRVRCVLSEGLAGAEVRASGPYDLILANILADPLCAMAPDIARALAPRGVAVLSGLLEQQAPAVRAAHRAERLRGLWTEEEAPWFTLVLGPMAGGLRRRRLRLAPQQAVTGIGWAGSIALRA